MTSLITTALCMTAVIVTRLKGMDNTESGTLQPPVLSCSCGNCNDYVDQHNGELECGHCGCLPLSHSYMKSSVEETSATDPGSQLPLLSLIDTSSVTNAKGKNKRPLGKSGKGLTKSLLGDVDPVQKKAKLESPVNAGSDETGIFQMKPCKILQRSHLPFTEMSSIPYSIRGVYKVAYDYKTIYVGSIPCNLRQTLRGHFNGSGNKDLYDFIKSLPQKDLEKISIFWLDETRYVHSCSGKKSYLKCIEEEEGRKPKFNVTVGKKLTSSGWCSVS